MQSNVTLTKIKRAFKSTALALGFLSLFTGLANAQTFVNGTLNTGATSASGVAAPAGFTWSECQNPTGNTNVANTLAGAGAQITANNSVADDFTVPAGPSWNLTKVTVYAYSTGYTGTTSPFNDVRVRIHSSNPLSGPSTIVYGDLTTNRFLASSGTTMYRIFNTVVTPATAPGTSRRIWQIEANVNVTLAPGTYWLEFRTGTAQASNFVPISAPVGVRTLPDYNAIQSLAGTWQALMDDGQGPSSPAPVATSVPFSIDYNTSVCSGTPAPGNTISSATAVCPGTGFSLSLQNATPGSGVTYQWQSGTSATGPWTNIAGATNNTYSVASISATTFYQAIVTCSGNSGTSTPVQVTLNPPSACYCVPTPASDCSDDDVIERVTVGGMNKTSTCAGGYSNYTTTDTASLIINAANPITVVTGDNWSEQVGVWVDYDRSGSFEASEFTNLGLTTAGSGGIHNGSIAVPSTVTTGYTRMRVRVRFSTALTGANACLSYAFGETEDYTVNLVPCVTSTITTQPPATKTISCSGTGTISATIAGSLNQYQWQVLATGSGAVWTDLTNNATYSGVNTNTLTITNALPNINGYQYRIRYSGACTSPSVTSATTLNIGALAPTVSNSLPINRCITDAPTAISIATPVGLAALSTTASGPLHTNIPDNNDETIGQNDNFISNNLVVNNIPPGATITGFNVKLNITHSWVGDMIIVLKAPDGKIINLDYALSATGGPGASTGFTNTVISSTGTALLSSGANPYTGTFRLDNAGPSTPGFTPTGPVGFDPNTTVLADMYQGNGTWTLAMYDYYGDFTSANFLENWELNISYTGQTTGTFAPTTGLFTDPAGTVAYTGQSVNTVYANPATSTTYTATVNTAVCGSGSVSIPVNVGSPLSGTSDVANITGCVGGDVTFSSTAPTGGLNATYQWQISTDGGANWTNISGATSATYTITGVTTAMTGNRYRVVRTVASCSSTLTSSAGILTVAPTPVLTVSANPYTAIYPGQTTTLAVASSTTVPANGYQWYKDGIAVPGATGNTLVVDIDGLGNYTVTASDANACGNVTVPSIAISAAQNDRLFIYPSPTSTGLFTIRYFSEFGPTAYPRLVNMYDMKGSRVYSKSFNINSPYTKLDIDASILGNGIYQVELIDLNGNRIKTGRVLIQK